MPLPFLFRCSAWAPLPCRAWRTCGCRGSRGASLASMATAAAFPAHEERIRPTGKGPGPGVAEAECSGVPCGSLVRSDPPPSGARAPGVGSAQQESRDRRRRMRWTVRCPAARPGPTRWPVPRSLLARRFAAGATMWCLAPGAPEHARHVAVEFVHPVIVGKRALPAVRVAGADPVAALRAVGPRPATCCSSVGAGADDPSWSTCSAGRRRGGSTTIWLGGRARARWPAPPTTCSGSTTTTRRRRYDGRLVLALPPALGAHPRVLRAPGPADADDRECADGRLHHLLRRGPAGRGGRGSTAAATPSVRTAARRRERSTSRWSATVAPGRPRARARRHGAHRSVDRSRGDDRLPLPLHRGRRARRRRAARRPRPRRPQAKARREPALAGLTLARASTELDAAAGAMAARLRARRPAVHVRQRRQLDRRRHAGRAVRPPAERSAAAGPLPGRRQRRPHRARPTTSATSSCSPASSSPTAGPATWRWASRPAASSAQPAGRVRRGQRAGHPHDRARRLRRRGDGGRRRSTTASWWSRTACTASRRPRRRSGSPSGERSRPARRRARRDADARG